MELSNAAQELPNAAQAQNDAAADVRENLPPVSTKTYPLEFDAVLATEALGYASFEAGLEALKELANDPEFEEEVMVGNYVDSAGAQKTNYLATVKALTKLSALANTPESLALSRFFQEGGVKSKCTAVATRSSGNDPDNLLAIEVQRTMQLRLRLERAKIEQLDAERTELTKRDVAEKNMKASMHDSEQKALSAIRAAEIQAETQLKIAELEAANRLKETEIRSEFKRKAAEFESKERTKRFKAGLRAGVNPKRISLDDPDSDTEDDVDNEDNHDNEPGENDTDDQNAPRASDRRHDPDREFRDALRAFLRSDKVRRSADLRVSTTKFSKYVKDNLRNVRFNHRLLVREMETFNLEKRACRVNGKMCQCFVGVDMAP